MPAPRTAVFIDEYGTDSLKLGSDGVTTLFILAAVMLPEERLDQARQVMAQISKARFNGNEVKSQGQGDLRRLHVLEDLRKIDFNYVALIVDKRLITEDSGLNYKQSFYKFIHGMLYKRIQRSGISCYFRPDMFGRDEFRASFANYMAERQNLFSSHELSFEDSKSEPLIGIADFVAGSLARIYDPGKQSPMRDDFQKLLAGHEVTILHHPPLYTRNPKEIGLLDESDSSEWDEKISQACLTKLGEYLIKCGASSNPLMLAQAEALKCLMNRRLLGNAKEQPITAVELIAYLQECGHSKMELRDFTRDIIGKLRHQGFIFAGGNKGYRLALAHADIRIYLEHDRRIIAPILTRLNIAQQEILLMTNSDLDFLDVPDQAYLKALAKTHAETEVAIALDFLDEEE